MASGGMNRLELVIGGNANPALEALLQLNEGSRKTQGELGKLDAEARKTQADLDKLGPAAQDAADGLRDTDQAADATGESVEDLANKAIVAQEKLRKMGEGAELLREFASFVDGIRDQLVASAGAADDLNDNLRGAFGDAADEVGALAQKLGTGFQVIPAESVAQAGKELQRLGAYSEEALTRVTNASAGTGESIEGLANAYGNFQKFGAEAPRALMTLQKALGASSKDLQDFGAVLDENTGDVLMDTEAHIDAARQAFDRFTDSRFGDALEKMADPAARLAGETELLKQELGRASIELREGFAPALLSAIQNARGLSDEMKGAIGLTLDFGAAALGAGAQGLGLAVQLKQAGVTMASLKSSASGAMAAVAGLSAGMMAFIAVAAAVGVALVVATEIQLQNNKANEEALKIEEARARALREHKNLIGKSAEELRKQGTSAKEVAELMLALDDQIQEARNRGDAEAEQRLKAERLRLGAVRKELSTTEAAKREETAKTAVSVKDAAAAEAKAKEDAAKAAEDTRKEGLAQDLHTIEVGAAARQLDKHAQIRALQEVLEKHKVTAEERRQIETKIAGLQGQLADEAARQAEQAEKKKVEAAKKAEAERKKLAEKAKQEREKAAEEAQKAAEKEAANLQKLESERLNLQGAAADERIADLKAQADAGKNVEAELVAALTARLAIEQEGIRAKAEAEKAATDSVLVREQIEVNTQLKIQAAVRDTDKAIKDAHDRQKKAAQDTNTELDKQLALLKAIQDEADGIKKDEGKADATPEEKEAQRARAGELRDQEISQKRRVEAAKKKAEAQARIDARTAELEAEEKKKKGQTTGQTDPPTAPPADASGSPPVSSEATGAPTSTPGPETGSTPPPETKPAPPTAPAVVTLDPGQLAQLVAGGKQSVEITVTGKDLGLDWKSNYSPNRAPGQR